MPLGSKLGGIVKTPFRAKLFSFGLVALAASSPALADWQYTKWGMSPDEVTSASKGKAYRITETPGSSYEGMTAANTGSYQIGQINLPVKFFYIDDKLSMVMLSGENDGLCYALRTVLDEQYGEPRSRSDRIVYEVFHWIDSDRGNRVQLTAFKNSSCSIYYFPLNSGPETGL